jgi:hypothetical protein
MTTLDESTIVAHRALEPSEDDTVRSGAQAWQLGILTDRAGHVHLGAVVAGAESGAFTYVDLLAPIGACRVDGLDLAQLVVLVHGGQLARFRQLVERCVSDTRLRDRLLELTRMSAAPEQRAAQ